RTNARPAATSPSASRSWRASPAKTSGGTEARRARAASAFSGSGQSGWWSAGYARHDDGDHAVGSGEVSVLSRVPWLIVAVYGRKQALKCQVLRTRGPTGLDEVTLSRTAPKCKGLSAPVRSAGVAASSRA